MGIEANSLFPRIQKTRRNTFQGSPLKNNTKRPAANLGDIFNKSSMSHFRRINHLRTQLFFLLWSASGNIYRKDLLCLWMAEQRNPLQERNYRRVAGSEQEHSKILFSETWYW